MLKLVVEQEMGLVESMKALLAFPTDIAFMALSFGAAILFVTPITTPDLNPGKVIAGFIVAGLFASVFIMSMSKKSDKAFTKEKWASCFGLATLGYGSSLTMLATAMNVGYFIK